MPNRISCQASPVEILIKLRKACPKFWKLTLSLSGENSQFIRINNAKIRQTGLVNNTDISFDFIYDNRNCQGQITLSGDYENDYNSCF